ncbi:hypothetical protein DSC45_13015 [Streptomyces sp. YIM 130001]|nr:hypothetical protein DSC45_13015 [Streptomyces sp. YIM 130001]
MPTAHDDTAHRVRRHPAVTPTRIRSDHALSGTPAVTCLGGRAFRGGAVGGTEPRARKRAGA